MLQVTHLAAAALLLQAPGVESEPRSLFTCGVALPTAAEIEGYVRDNWLDFEDRLRPYPAVAPERLQFARVTGAECRYRFATPNCRFTLTGRRASGEEVSAMLETDFARDGEGRLAGEVIVIGPDPACRRG